MYRQTLMMACIIAILFTVSCSGNVGDAITPETNGQGINADLSNDGQVCLGIWQMTADASTGNVDVVQLRSADKILNLVGVMLQYSWDIFEIDMDNSTFDFDNLTAELAVILTNPLPDTAMTAFDMRGICFGPKVVNADGLTIVTSPEYFEGVTYGYQDVPGLAPDFFVNYGGLAGYKYFCDNLGAEEDLAEFYSDPENVAARGQLSNGSYCTRMYDIDWNGTGENFQICNFAIYANSAKPSGSPPYSLDDFPITTANSAEAFCISVANADTLYLTAGAAWRTFSWKSGTGRMISTM